MWTQACSVEPQPISILRQSQWSGVPSSPGVYWWYFPRYTLDNFRIAELCDATRLRLRYAGDGKVCLYHGMAKDVAQRIAWHAAQKLTVNTLRSGFLSTFRFSLLALNDFDYLKGAEQIDGFFDGLSVDWKTTANREDATAIERAELQSNPYHYPLNIQGNRRPELLSYLLHLKSTRQNYKRRYLHQLD